MSVYLTSRIPTMTDTTLTPSKLWKQMSLAQRVAAARAFWNDEEAIDDQVQAAFLIAQKKKFRPKTVIGLDIERKAAHLASLRVFDNSAEGDPKAGKPPQPVLLLHMESGRVVAHVPLKQVPQWAKPILAVAFEMSAASH